jgi:hypothetical protein
MPRISMSRGQSVTLPKKSVESSQHVELTDALKTLESFDYNEVKAALAKVASVLELTALLW